MPSGPQSIDVAISAPAEAPVGQYQLNVHFDSGQGASSSYELGEILLLFNAWCPGTGTASSIAGALSPCLSRPQPPSNA